MSKKMIGAKLRRHREEVFKLSITDFVSLINRSAPLSVRTNIKNYSKYELGINRCPVELYVKIQDMERRRAL